MSISNALDWEQNLLQTRIESSIIVVAAIEDFKIGAQRCVNARPQFFIIIDDSDARPDCVLTHSVFVVAH